MDCRLTLLTLLTVWAPACPEDIPAPVRPATAEIAQTYRADYYSLFRCVVGATPELRNPQTGWWMNYSEAFASIEAGPVEIHFQRVSRVETEVRVTALENPYPQFYPGRWTAAAEACASTPEAQLPSLPPHPPLSGEPDQPSRRRTPIRAKM